MSEIADTLKQHHVALRGALEILKSKKGDDLVSELKRLQPAVTALLTSEETLFAEILRACAQRNDTGSANIARIFEGNLKVMAAGIRGFFDQLAVLAKDPRQLEQRARTMIDVLNSQMETEGRAVIPLHTKLTKAA